MAMLTIFTVDFIQGHQRAALIHSYLILDLILIDSHINTFRGMLLYKNYIYSITTLNF